MLAKRKSFNPKRRIASAPVQADLDRLAGEVRYGGKPDHKRNPGDFGLTPPSLPRDDKSLCDEIRLFRRAEALRLLRLGVERGMISPWDGTGYPKNIWFDVRGWNPVGSSVGESRQWNVSRLPT